VLGLQRAQLPVPRRDAEDQREGAIVLYEDGKGEIADLAARPTQEERVARDPHAIAKTEMAAVVEQAAFAAALEHRPGSPRL
jgi:hypothetical protein